MTRRSPAKRSDITVAEIADALAMNAAWIAEKIVEEKPTFRSSRELRFYPKGGLRVQVAGPKRGRWKNFGDDEGGDLLDLYQYIKGESKADAVRWAKDQLGLSSDAPAPELPKRDRAAEKKEFEDELAKRRRTAAFLWRTAGRLAGTPAEAYLRGRGITCELPACVGHRHLDANAMEKMGLLAEHNGPLDTATFKAVNLQGQVAAVQQVIIDPAQTPPQKADVSNKKRTNGVMEGSAVHLGEPDDEIILAEGPETGGSIYQALGQAVWLVLGTFNFTRVELPARIKRVVIAVDIEESGAGLAAAVAAAGYWQAQGKRVALMIPDLDDGDFNDVLQQEDGVARIRKAYETAVEPARQPHTDAWLIVRDPRDALAAWRATGLKVKATLKPLNPYRDLDDAEIGRAILLGQPGQPLDLEDWTPRPDQCVFEITTTKLTLAELHAEGGDGAIYRLLRLAAPLGKRFLYGLEACAMKPDAPVVVVDSRRALLAARKLLPDAAVVAFRADAGPEAYHWTPLRSRQLVLAPPAGPEAARQTARYVRQLHAAGVRDIRVVEWPLCRRDATGWRQIRDAIPDGYDFTAARKDGWTPRTAGSLLEMARPVPAEAAVRRVA